MKRSITVIALVVFALSFVGVSESWARAGGGGSGGSRGSRSYSAPARPSPGQVSPSRPAAPQSPMAPAPAPQRPGWGGMIGGLLLGGLLGGLLFGGLGGHGLFGGLGLLEIVVIGGLILFAISWMRRRQVQSPGPAYAVGYGAGGYGSAGWTPAERSMPAATVEAPPEPTDLDKGLGHIRQMDGAFDAAAFAETASDMFFKIQAAWTGRDVARAADLLTPEMQGLLQEQSDRLRAEHRINRLENIAVRQASVTEAWQEKGQDYVTVHFLASLLDYTTDESGRVVEGSTTEPVKFEEYWTFTRPVGPNRFTLSAIQQAA